jgi:hypothetical protein
MFEKMNASFVVAQNLVPAVYHRPASSRYDRRRFWNFEVVMGNDQGVSGLDVLLHFLMKKTHT